MKKLSDEMAQVIEYRSRIARAVSEIEAGNTMKAYYILQGEIKKCIQCGQYQTHDHECGDTANDHTS
jgi:hypothetical protein